MEFTLLYSENGVNGTLTTFNQDKQNEHKTIEFSDLKHYSVQGLVYNLEENSQVVLSEIEQENKFYPIRSKQYFQNNFENIEKLTYNESKIIFDKMRESWILQKNLSLLSEIFKVRTHLLSLWPNDRSSFFEELWFILKNNLGAKSVTLFYNDLLKGKSENDKNKLVKVKVEGNRFPELKNCEDTDEIILKNYEKYFTNTFEITDLDLKKGQIVICAVLKKSPVLIMASIYQLTKLQETLLATLFEGLNEVSNSNR